MSKNKQNSVKKIKHFRYNSVVGPITFINVKIEVLHTYIIITFNPDHIHLGFRSHWWNGSALRHLLWSGSRTELFWTEEQSSFSKIHQSPMTYLTSNHSKIFSHQTETPPWQKKMELLPMLQQHGRFMLIWAAVGFLYHS